MPAFMRSEGPYAIYDHSLRHVNAAVSDLSPTVTDKAALAALHRYE